MKALFELFRRFDARRIFGFIRRLGGMSRPKIKCYDLRSIHALRVEGDPVLRSLSYKISISIHALRVEGDVVPNHLTEQWVAISIHALRGVGDVVPNHLTEQWGAISIHALRVEGDLLKL